MAKTASDQAAAQILQAKFDEAVAADEQREKILLELEQIANKPDSAAAREDAYPKLDALRDNYGDAAVGEVMTDIVALGAFGDNSLLDPYARSKAGLTDDIQRATSGNTVDPTDLYIHKGDVLEDNDSVVKSGEENDQTKDLTGESFINLTSQTHQCILQHYVDDIAEFHRMKISRGNSDEEGNTLLDATTAPFAPSGDQKIILIDDSDPDSSVTPINALTSLGKTSGLSTLLPADLAKAMPKLRLYKIYRKNGKESGKVEFKFPTDTDSGFLTQNTSGSANAEFTMSPGYAKGRAAGIKSFDWSFVGGDPFTATRDLTAKLTIFFQDFRDLTLVRQGANLLDEKRKLQPYKYLDLIVQPDCRGESFTASSTTSPVRKTTNKEMIFNPDCYEIAVEVGYADSTDLPLALKNRNDTLYLTMVEHSFDIGQDGTFSLSIDYRARLATLLGDKGMNVLSPGGGHIIKDDPNSTGLVFDIREVQRQIDAEESKSSPDKLELDALRATEKHLLYVRNNGLYRSITATLLNESCLYDLSVPIETFEKFSQFNKYNREGGKNKLVGIDDAPALEPNAISEAGSLENLDENITAIEEGKETKVEYVERGSGRVPGSDEAGPGVMQVQTSYNKLVKETLHFTTVGNLIAVAIAHITGENAFSLGTQGDIEDIKNIHKAAQKDYDESIATTEKIKEEAIEAAKDVTAGSGITTTETVETQGTVNTYDKVVPIEATAGADLKASINEAQRNLLERFRVILGSISYEDARSGKMKAINIAHLPVSMQMFRQFMLDRVINNQRSFYSFQDFVRDILTDIVFDSLQRICFGGSTQDAQIRTGISLFNGQGAGDKGTSEPIASLTDDKLYGFRRPNPTDKALYKSLSPAAAKSDNPIFTNIVSDSALDFSYLMFTAFSVAALNKNLHGNEVDDNDNGIAHFRYGSTTGMMKSINFSKTPLEFAAEERYVREGSDNLLNQLAGRYEMQMSLVGNNMFIPGQYVYFDPVALGIGKSMTNDGSSRSLANLMGLGGYHIITEVGCSIAPGKFETTIKALWETGGSMPPATKPEGAQ